MKNWLFVALLFVASTALAQRPAWKEMKDFHSVMSKSYHPTEKNDFVPLKQNATQLYDQAKTWSKSEVPQGYDAKKVKPVLKQLVKSTKAVKKAVEKQANDETLKTLIVKAHDDFHQIMEACTPDDHKE